MQVCYEIYVFHLPLDSDAFLLYISTLSFTHSYTLTHLFKRRSTTQAKIGESAVWIDLHPSCACVYAFTWRAMVLFNCVNIFGILSIEWFVFAEYNKPSVDILYCYTIRVYVCTCGTLNINAVNKIIRLNYFSKQIDFYYNVKKSFWLKLKKKKNNNRTLNYID